MAKCVEAMKELDTLEVVATMLVKYPAIIDTLKKVDVLPGSTLQYTEQHICF